MEKVYSKITVPDVALSLAAVLISFWFIFIPQTRASENTTLTLQIYQNGNLLKEVVILKDEIINLDLGKNKMSVEIKPDKGVHILNSDCPAKVCVHTGWIKTPGETIVCLPNKVLLELKGVKEEYHAISY